MIAEFDLSRRTALVIGAAGGLGREQALGLARAGADVAIADLYAVADAVTRRLLTHLLVKF